MSPAAAQRQLILAGAALLALVAALAISAGFGGSSTSGTELSSVAPPGGGWYRALAGSYRLAAGKKRTACGQRATAATLGLAHPVLPCGAKIVLRYGDVQVLTQVIDRGTGAPGREFELTAALAHRIGLAGVQPVRWRFAAAP